MSPAWTFEEIEAFIPKLKQELEETEAEFEGKVKGFPPMTKEEAKDYLLRLGNLAEERPLTKEEAFAHGQLLCVYEQSIRAEMLGKKGRYFCISEEQIKNMVKGV